MTQTMKWDGSLSEIDKKFKIELIEYEKSKKLVKHTHFKQPRIMVYQDDIMMMECSYILSANQLSSNCINNEVQIC